MPEPPETPRPPALTIVDHPLVQHKLSLMRKRETSTSKFRALLREVSLLLAYEATRNLALEETEIETPLEAARMPVLAGKKVCLVSILRAGNGILDGMLDLMPSARVGHIGIYREPRTLQAVEYYLKLPEALPGREPGGFRASASNFSGGGDCHGGARPLPQRPRLYLARAGRRRRPAVRNKIKPQRLGSAARGALPPS